MTSDRAYTDKPPAQRVAVLSLQAVDRNQDASPGQQDRARYVPRLNGPLTQLDFLVDGERLSRLLEIVEVPEPDISGFQNGLDMLSVADLAWPQEAAEALRRLAGVQAPSPEFPLGLGRLPLYVCSACGDLGCGALTVEVIHDDAAGTVTWQDFRVQDEFHPDLLDLSAMPTWVFDAAQYRAALLDPVAELDALHADEQAAEAAWRSSRKARARIRRLLNMQR